MSTREELKSRAAALVERLSDGRCDDAARDALLLDLVRFAASRIPPFARLLAARGCDPSRVKRLDDVPALPTDVFKHVRVATHPPTEDRRVFHTSGTTGSTPGRHAFRDLDLYVHAARAAAKHALFHDVDRMDLVVLAPPETEAPHSSLSFMLSRFEEHFGATTTWVWRDGALDLEVLARALKAAGRPVALLGTSFAFVHADEGLGDARFELPPQSRIMQTGGYKGRSRELAPRDMRARLAARYGVPEESVIAEYGMTELSSQMYETTLREPAAPRRLWVPGWMRAVPVSPETLGPVPTGEVGILRIDDAANLDSVCAVQTSDLARAVNDGIELVGRAAGAPPRGCSLAVDEILGRAP